MPGLTAAAAADDDDIEVSGGCCDDELRYRELYSRCWYAERDLRPSAVQLVDVLSRWTSTA